MKRTLAQDVDSFLGIGVGFSTVSGDSWFAADCASHWGKEEFDKACQSRRGQLKRGEVPKVVLNATPDAATALLVQLKKLDRLPQRQDGTIAQLADLLPFANKLGLYDAADLIKTLIKAR